VRERHEVRAANRVNLNGAELPLGFRTLLRSGQSATGTACDSSTAGAASCYGTIPKADGTPMRDDNGDIVVASSQDFASLMKVGDKVFMVSQFESPVASLFVTHVNQEASNGLVTATATRSVDLSPVDGLWTTCAGSTTPWNTYLSSEEYPFDGKTFASLSTWPSGRDLIHFKAFAQYWGIATADGLDAAEWDTFKTKFSPYFHGFATEVSLDANGTPTLKKHYAMGRHSMELAYVMPDRKTVLLTSDGSGEGLHMFVADTAGDLSAGRLFAMRIYQTSPRGELLRGDLEWIDLGHATHADIHALLHPAPGQARVTFGDIFAVGAKDASGACDTAGGFKLVAGDCLKVKDGMEKAASRLETRRYAMLKGATLEMNKEEGVTFDPDTNRVYLAISDLTGTMASANPSIDDGTHVQSVANRCGAVFAMDVGPWTEAAGDASRTVSRYAPMNIYPLVHGVAISYPAASPYVGNECSINGLASPDNVTYLPGYSTLIIGEDTDKHQNDAVWAFHTLTGKLTRIMTTPYGAETTSPYWVPSLNGFGYLMAAVQHPYGESDVERAKDEGATGSASHVGVFGPFPELK
jgi:hypothetical protein